MDPGVLLILGIIEQAFVAFNNLPVAVRTEQAEEFQADLDWWRHLLHLYVPESLPVPVKAVPGTPTPTGASVTALGASVASAILNATPKP